jgi:p-hydroxybenzoate 3-monooxygenase
MPQTSRRAYLAGDAAHIVPPTGARGLNLAAADVLLLTKAFAAFYQAGNTDLLNQYSDTALKRVWRSQRFSWWMTQTLHASLTKIPLTTGADCRTWITSQARRSR